MDLKCWILLGFGSVVGVVGWCWFKQMMNKSRRQDDKCGVPKGNSGWPFIGETLDFITCGYSSRPVSFMEKRKSLYGKVFRTHLLGNAIIVSTDPEVNKVVLQNHGNNFIPAYPKTINELLGKSSILQMNGSHHKRMHALIGNFLKSANLKSRITKDIEQSVKLSLSCWNDTQLVYIQDETKKITFEILVKVLMSLGPGEDLEFLKKEYEEFIKGLICLPVKFPGTTLYKSLKAKERLLKVVRKIVAERKKTMDGKDEKSQPKDAVDLLLHDSHDQLNDTRDRPLDFICGNIIEMMIPGEDSVPMVITIAVKFLSDYPVVLTKLMEENMELKSRKLHCGDDYTWMDYMSLPFTQNVISETLRLANIINGIWRKALKDVEIKGYLIPKGWTVLASLTSIHMDEEIYENPFEFNPWRWEKTGGGMVNYNTNFTPFGGGQRLCPGLELSRLEISIFLHHFVTTFRWVAEKDKIITFPTVKMRKKMPIRVTAII